MSTALPLSWRDWHAGTGTGMPARTGSVYYLTDLAGLPTAADARARVGELVISRVNDYNLHRWDQEVRDGHLT